MKRNSGKKNSEFFEKKLWKKNSEFFEKLWKKKNSGFFKGTRQNKIFLVLKKKVFKKQFIFQKIFFLKK